MEVVDLGGRTVNRLGISTGELRGTGVWGEPTSRSTAIAVIRRAVELGADVIEVPIPFGPSADLFREAGVHATFVVARLTDRLPSLDALVHRLGGRRPDLVIAEERYLDDMRSWPVPLGAIIGPHSRRALFEPLRAVRGPWPARRQIVAWCEENGLPYMASSTEILRAGERTIALPAVKSIKEIERMFAPTATAPTATAPTASSAEPAPTGGHDPETETETTPATPPTAGLG